MNALWCYVYYYERTMMDWMPRPCVLNHLAKAYRQHPAISAGGALREPLERLRCRVCFDRRHYAADSKIRVQLRDELNRVFRSLSFCRWVTSSGAQGGKKKASTATLTFGEHENRTPVVAFMNSGH